MAKSLTKKLQKRGNSHALVIDSVLMDQLGIGPDTLLQLTVTGGSLVVTPVFSGAGPKKVKDALAAIRSQPGYPEMLSNLAK
jgi:antitoxin component of MazEF toxin-antitoxin module